MQFKRVEAQIRGINSLFRLEWQDLGTSLVLKVKDSIDQDLMTIARSKDPLEDPTELFETAKKNLDVLKEAIKEMRASIYG